MVIELITALLSALVVIVPLLMKRHYDKKVEGEKTRRQLLERDITALRADLKRLFPGQTPPHVP
jgi:hypothetical protein